MVEPMIIKTLEHFVPLNMADIHGFKVMSMLASSTLNIYLRKLNVETRICCCMCEIFLQSLNRDRLAGGMPDPPMM